MILLVLLSIIVGYLLGSIPSAVIVSRLAKGVDIRTLGDGNMGARNTARNLGMRYGILVAVADFCKGALTILFARALGLSLGMQMLAGIASIIGHDFPVFAGFKGGQGLADTLGTLLALFPTQTLIGLIVYGLLFLIIKNSDISAGIGCGLIALILGIQQNWMGLFFMVVMMISIPMKKILDDSRRKALGTTQETEK